MISSTLWASHCFAPVMAIVVLPSSRRSSRMRMLASCRRPGELEEGGTMRILLRAAEHKQRPRGSGTRVRLAEPEHSPPVE